MINTEELKKGLLNPLMNTVEELNKKLLPKLNPKEKALLKEKTSQLQAAISNNDTEGLLTFIKTVGNAD